VQPVQRSRTNPGFGVAVRLISRPSSKPALHAVGQAMPEGVLVTLPPDEGATLSVCFGGAVHGMPTACAIACPKA
jgi:hypothetical protein